MVPDVGIGAFYLFVIFLLATEHGIRTIRGFRISILDAPITRITRKAMGRGREAIKEVD